jgi:hypothetical protein
MNKHTYTKNFKHQQMHKEFFLVNYNTLLHVSTLLGHLQGETFLCRYTMLHYTVQRECVVDCALRRLWRRELFCSLGLCRTLVGYAWNVCWSGSR